MILRDFVYLFYPRNCPACKSLLAANEQKLCSVCLATLPFTGQQLTIETPVARIFQGRIPLTGAASFFFFDKGSRVQNLIHQIKYKGEKELAVHLGEMFGYTMQDVSTRETVLLPVPLHARKKKRRGYNQSEEIAKGIAASTGWSLLPGALSRTKYTETQTRKTRAERWDNVSESFCVNEPELIYGKRVIVVDDVLTTGATIEACANVIETAQPAEICVATLACALKL